MKRFVIGAVMLLISSGYVLANESHPEAYSSGMICDSAEQLTEIITAMHSGTEFQLAVSTINKKANSQACQMFRGMALVLEDTGTNIDCGKTESGADESCDIIRVGVKVMLIAPGMGISFPEPLVQYMIRTSTDVAI